MSLVVALTSHPQKAHVLEAPGEYSTKPHATDRTTHDEHVRVDREGTAQASDLEHGDGDQKAPFYRPYFACSAKWHFCHCRREEVD